MATPIRPMSHMTEDEIYDFVASARAALRDCAIDLVGQAVCALSADALYEPSQQRRRWWKP